MTIPNPPQATVIEIIAVIAFIIVIIRGIKLFFMPKNKERETISRSARSQSQLIGRRTKK